MSSEQKAACKLLGKEIILFEENYQKKELELSRSTILKSSFKFVPINGFHIHLYCKNDWERIIKNKIIFRNQEHHIFEEEEILLKINKVIKPPSKKKSEKIRKKYQTADQNQKLTIINNLNSISPSFEVNFNTPGSLMVKPQGQDYNYYKITNYENTDQIIVELKNLLTIISKAWDKEFRDPRAVPDNSRQYEISYESHNAIKEYLEL